MPPNAYALARADPHFADRARIRGEHDRAEQALGRGADEGRIKEVDGEEIRRAANFERAAGRTEAAGTGDGRSLKQRRGHFRGEGTGPLPITAQLKLQQPRIVEQIGLLLTIRAEREDDAGGEELRRGKRPFTARQFRRGTGADGHPRGTERSDIFIAEMRAVDGGEPLVEKSVICQERGRRAAVFSDA